MSFTKHGKGQSLGVVTVTADDKTVPEVDGKSVKSTQVAGK